MKKLMAILLCIAMLLLVGCRTQSDPKETTVPPETQNVETIPPETENVATEPIATEPPAPQTISGIALADYVTVLLATVDRDTVLNIVGEFDQDHYVIKLENCYGLIEKRLVRLEGEAAYEQWNGYSYSGAKFYTNYHLLLTEDTRELVMNTQLVVLDTLDDCVVVQLGEEIGYMNPDWISRNYIQYTPGSGSQDGGDISLNNRAGILNLSAVAPQTGNANGSAVVRANGAEIILGWYDRGEEIRIISEEGFVEAKEGWHIIYADGLWGYVRQELVAMEGAEPYAEWSGYTRLQAGVYNNYYLCGVPVLKPSTNTVVQILADLGNCYLISIEDQVGCIAKEMISETPITYGGGGGGEWSDPVM